MDPQKKSREQVIAEREAKKLAKALAKNKGKVKDKVEPKASAAQLNSAEKNKVQVKPVLDKTELEKQNNANIVFQCTKEDVLPNIAIEEKKLIDETIKIKDSKMSEKSVKSLREERRALQETQRAAKAALLAEKKKPVKLTSDKKDKSATMFKKVGMKIEMKKNLQEVNLFKHLYINRNISHFISSNNENLHPAIIRLGVLYADKVIVGSNARCVALLAAVKRLIDEFECPVQADFTRGLEASLIQAKNYLDYCRPLSVSMENALKHLQRQMSILPSTIPDKEAKLKLTNAIDIYVQEQINLADKAISQAIQKKIVNGDVILTYGFSSLIQKILCDAYDANKEFQVVVIDGSPWFEGRELLRRLVKHGIDCSLMLINAITCIMPQVDKVFLGAHAILANGAVISRVGSAQVASMANFYNVPVLVACETYKSSERVQTDSIVFNEIGDPNQLVNSTFYNLKKSCLSSWKSKKSLNLLNITYDITPADLVSAVVTELAILPCSSAPVLLRIKPSKMEKN